MTLTTATTTPGSRTCNKKIVRIRVTKETADRLRLLSHDEEESWDDIIRRLIAYYEEDKNSILREAKRSNLRNE
jgi:hypothetical protein